MVYVSILHIFGSHFIALNTSIVMLYLHVFSMFYFRMFRWCIQQQKNKSISWKWWTSKFPWRIAPFWTTTLLTEYLKIFLALVVLWRSCLSHTGSYSVIQKIIFYVCVKFPCVCKVSMYANQISVIFYLMGSNILCILKKHWIELACEWKAVESNIMTLKSNRSFSNLRAIIHKLRIVISSYIKQG